MFSAAVKIVDQFKKVEVAKNEAAYKNFGHAASSIRKDAAASIEKADGPSSPDEPPHTHRGHLKRAIRFWFDAMSAVIGPRASVVDDAGARLEFGEEFEPRPFMGPALERAIPRLGDTWEGSIGA